MQDFFKHILYSTDELDLEKLFNQLGINYQLIPENKQMEKGGYVKTTVDRKNNGSLNVSHKTHTSGAEIVSVQEGGSACNFGLSNKDIIIAIDDYKISSQELDSKIASYPINTDVKVSYFRRDKLNHKQVTLKASDANTCYLSLKSENTNSAFDEWINP